MSFGTHCKHYRGREMMLGKDRKCGAGIDPVFSFCEGNTFGWVTRAPCFKSNVDAPPCPSQVFATPEEARAEAEAFERYIDDFMTFVSTARGRILEIAQETNASSGAIDCPKCGTVNALRWTRARCNGHVHAQCSTKDCLGWME